MANKRKTSSKMARKAGRAFRGAARKLKKAINGPQLAEASALDMPAISAAQMLADPCNAALAPGCYRGDQGYKTRVVLNETLGTGTGISCVAIAYAPTSGNRYVLTTVAAGTLAAWTNLGVVSGAFFGSNASAVRSLGACVSTTPSAPNLATSGQVYTAVVPASALTLAGTDSPSGLSILCNQYGKVPIDTPVETKFVPASSDEDFATVGTNSDLSDNNVILQVYLGLPLNGTVGYGITVRYTNIVEWKPLTNLGFVSQSYLGNPSRNTIEHVKEALRKKDPHWYTNVGKMAYSVIRGYATGGALGATGAAMRGVSNLF